MKIRTKPQEYEAIVFNGITEELNKFLEGTDSTIRKNDDRFELSNFVGHHGVDFGDYIYKADYGLKIASVIRIGESFNKHFEVVEND